MNKLLNKKKRNGEKSINRSSQPGIPYGLGTHKFFFYRTYHSTPEAKELQNKHISSYRRINYFISRANLLDSPCLFVCLCRCRCSCRSHSFVRNPCIVVPLFSHHRNTRTRAFGFHSIMYQMELDEIKMQIILYFSK